MITDDQFEGLRVTVMGLGRFGGGLGATRFLASRGADVLVTDLADGTALAKSIGALRDLIDTGRVELRLGGHNVSDFTTAGLVIANPAVPKPWDNRFLRAAWAAGVPVSSEIRLAVDRLPAGVRTIGVTGTAGKSTTAAMIAHALGSFGSKAVLAGNIGASLLDGLCAVHHTAEPDAVVLELSSAQLHWLRTDAGGGPDTDAWTPDIAVLTNLVENHLDWHGDIGHYARSKRSIVREDGGSPLLYLEDEPSSRTWRDWPAKHLPLGGSDLEALVRTLDVPLPGRHNRRNAALAAHTVRMLVGGMDDASQTRSMLAGFSGLAHRLAFCGEFRGVRIFNDSKCTTPGGCVLALRAMSPDEGGPGVGRVHLIAGGYDKGVDLSSMVEAASACASVATIGTVGEALAASLMAAGARARCMGHLEAAVRWSCAQCSAGDVLLLSPGCASWDQFSDYEARGERFLRAATSCLQDRSGAAPAGGRG